VGVWQWQKSLSILESRSSLFWAALDGFFYLENLFLGLALMGYDARSIRIWDPSIAFLFLLWLDAGVDMGRCLLHDGTVAAGGQLEK